MILFFLLENHIIFKCITKDVWDYALFTRWLFIFKDITIATADNRNIP